MFYSHFGKRRPKSPIFVIVGYNTPSEMIEYRGKQYQQIYVFDRVVKRRDHFIYVTMDGRDYLLDRTVPLQLDKKPRGGVKLSPERCAYLWEMKSHYFGYPDPEPFNKKEGKTG